VDNVLTVVAAATQSGGLASFLPFLIIGAVFLMMILPQRKQKQRQAELLASLASGDEVVTSGGIHGVINVIEGDVVHLQVDSDVVIRVSRGAIAGKVNQVVEEPHDSNDAADGKSTKK
jgi:preprotein translocase subunit YajC